MSGDLIVPGSSGWEQPRAGTPDTPSIDVHRVNIDTGCDLHLAGMNVALRRTPKLDTLRPELAFKIGYVPSWKPVGPTIKTVGLKFPLGLELKPPARVEQTGELKSISVPRPVAAAASGEITAEDAANRLPAKKATRIRPPAEALSLEDRLFYVLQPPLQSWFENQELVLPFEPFAYQYEGIAWLFSQKSALLADEMGLGKTMQTITAIRLLLRAAQVQRILLVCPKPLIPNWQREFKFWAEEIPLTTLEGDKPRRQMLWRMTTAPVLLANYETMVRDMAEFADEDKPRFDLVVLDEAQRIKNRESRTSQVTRSIPRRRSWALSGTPIENRAEEMGALFEFMNVVPPDATPELRQLKQLAEIYVLRRTKDLVMTDMPPRLDRDAYLELSPAQALAYQTAEKDGVMALNDKGDEITIHHVFELVMRLKQITNYDPFTQESVKLDRLLADMEEIQASGKKAILFSQWTRTIDWIAERTKSFNALVYHGGIPTKQREPILKQFKEDPQAHLLLMSYGTGAVGLNLQFSNYVFLFDRWWNPAIEDQAINRAHRIGQKSSVIVTRFICKDTIEERIDKVLQQKRDLFHAVLGAGDTTTPQLSLNAAEIFGLFDIKARSAEGTRKVGPKVA